MEQIFNINNVSQQYTHFKLEQINLSLNEGEIMGLIGPNGAGKSTVIKTLMGLIKPDSGKVELLGKSIPEQVAKAKMDVGYVSEEMRLYKSMTLQWHMDFIASIYPSWDNDYAKKLLKHFDLIAEQKVKGMSHGQRVKANLLLNFARRPKLLILDEPTTGLDPVARKEVLNELMEVMLDEERSVLFSSHNTQDVEQLSDKITFIDRGKIVNSDDKETFIENWKRIRIEFSQAFDESKVQNIVESQMQESSGVLVTNQFNQTLIDNINHLNANVKSIEPMTLEEIFVADVFASRQGAE